jgi:Na+-translocating ferredoxin:NAD+ oxidoreductase subunit D
MLKLNNPPHMKTKDSSKRIMFTMILLLLIPSFGAIYYFGLKALYIIVTCVVSAQITESVILKIRGKSTKITGGAIITGLLLGLTLPVLVPLWLCIIGSIFAIVVGKQIFGGSGYNIFNPALVGRVFIGIGWPQFINSYSPTQMIGTDLWFNIVDSVTTATPLVSKEGYNYSILFFGNHAGCIGETSILLILIAGFILTLKKYIDIKIPFFMVGTVFVLSFISGIDPFYQILSGGLIFAAFFMATDYVTSPITNKGRIIYAISIGLLIYIARVYGNMPEGVTYAILFMNALVPLIDRYTQNKIFGSLK